MSNIHHVHESGIKFKRLCVMLNCRRQTWLGEAYVAQAFKPVRVILTKSLLES